MNLLTRYMPLINPSGDYEVLNVTCETTKYKNWLAKQLIELGNQPALGNLISFLCFCGEKTAFTTLGWNCTVPEMAPHEENNESLLSTQ